MRRHIDESGIGDRKRRRWIAAAGLLMAAMLVIPVWQLAQVQTPPSGAPLEGVSEDEDGRERQRRDKSGAVGCLFWCESCHVSQLLLDERAVR